MIATEPWQMDFSDYLKSQGGVYAPFPAAVEFVHSLEWCNSIWEALLAGMRPPEHRVAEMLRQQVHLKGYLPENIAVNYPNVPNPFLAEALKP